MVKPNTIFRVLVLVLLIGAPQVDAMRVEGEDTLEKGGAFGNGPTQNMTTPQINQRLREMQYPARPGKCYKCTQVPPPFDASCWSEAPNGTHWKDKKLYSQNNEMCLCPVNYDDVTQTDTLLKRAPTKEEEQHLKTIKLCKRVKKVFTVMEEKCMEWVETNVSSFSAYHLEKADSLSVSRLQPLLSEGWDHEFRASIRRNIYPCYKAERFYTGNGMREAGFAVFNALLRNAHLLGAQGFKNYNGKPGLIPQSVLQTAAFLVKELEGHQPAPGKGEPPLIRDRYATNWPKSTTELLYRGAYCTPLAQGDKIIVTSFLSTSVSPPTEFISESKCVFIFRNVHSAKPHRMYVGEKEILLPMGTCLKVVKRGLPGEMLVGDTPASQKTALQKLKSTEHQYQYLLDGIKCPNDLNSKDLKVL